MLVAREEIRLSKAGVKSVNFELFRKFQGRSADAIKCLRRSAKYKAIRDRLTTESEGALTDWLPGGHEHGESMEVVCEDEAVASDPHPSGEKGETVSSPDLEGNQKGRSWCTPIPKTRKGPKFRWADEELESMAREELLLAANGCRKLNIELTKFFPQRTLEGVKGMRRNAKYKSLLSSLQAPSAALPGHSPSTAVACDEESRGLPLPPHRTIL